MAGGAEFAAQVEDWVRRSSMAMEAIFKESTQRVIAQMQTPVGAGGNMPVVTGFLWNSNITTLNAPASSVTYNPLPSGSGQAFAWDPMQAVLTIAKAKLGDTIYSVYTANYAVYVEYGARGRAGYGFVRLAAQNWQNIVNEVAAEAKARSGRNG